MSPLLPNLSLRSLFYKLLYLLVLFFGVLGELRAQFYPVHGVVQWPAPQSPYLVDYYSGSRDRLIITLHNRDLQQPLLFARLRVRIKSLGFLAETREEMPYPMLELLAGTSTRLTVTDLMPYLRPENLRMNGRLREGKLPTGFTEFSVQVVDFYSGRVLSNWHTGRAYLDVKKPPILNVPERDEQVSYRDPIFIRFQWMPRHQGLAGTEYEFVLKELPDNGAAPQSAFTYGNEIYRVRTRNTFLNYTHLEPILRPNRRYAWQVQAIARDGIDEIGMFENRGFSEIYWFSLNENCPVPTGLKAQARYAKVDFSWNRVIGATGYMLACRPKTSKDIYEWSEVQSYEERTTIAQLKPGWTYEWRVGTLCTGDIPIYSPIQEVTLPKNNEELLASCGKEPPRRDLRQEPRLDVVPGDTIIIGGDYPMLVTEIKSLGDGWYSGRGKTSLSSIIEVSNVALRFDRLRINVDNFQIDGLVEAIYDDKKPLANLDQFDDGGKALSRSTLRIRERKVAFALPDAPEMNFNPETGELETTDAEGNPQRIKLDFPEGGDYASAFPMVITDAGGNEYQVREQTSTYGVDERSPNRQTEGDSVGGRKALRVERVERIGAFDAEQLEHSFGLVRFRSSAQARYALDLGDESWYLGSVKMDSFYKEFARGYIAPWKLIPTGERDVVEAYYEGSKDIDLSRVRFASAPDSPALPADYDEARKAWTLTLPASESNSSYEVFALYQGKVIGKLCVVSYPKQSYKLRLVPVNGQSLGDGSRLSQQLNSIYNKHGVSFTLYEGEGVSSELKAKSLGQDLRKLQEDYKAQHSLSGNEVCLFILSTELSKGSKYEELEGLMPRAKRFGYIFVGNSPNEEALARTLAHELGHGLFTLQHTFDNEYGGKKSKGKTQNLMDYTEGATELAAFQWNVIANKAPFTALDREKEAQKVRFEGLIDGKNNGITPSGKVIRSIEATDKQKTAILGISADSHFVKSIILFDGTKRINSYNWDKSLETYISSNGDRIEDASDIVLTYNSESRVNSARLYKLVSGEKCFYQYIDVSFTSGDLSSLKIPNRDWNTAFLWNASESCTAEFISKRVLKRDREAYSPEQIKAEQEKLKELSAATPIDELIDRLQGYHILTLKTLSYETLIGFIKRVASQETLRERDELAILRLMQAMDGRDYAKFYRELEANKNALLRHLVSEIDDASLYFWKDKDNYTNFIGALVWMFNADKGQSIATRWLNDDTIATSILNLEPITYGALESSLFSTNWKTKHNSGSYDASTGEVTLYDVYTTRLSNPSRETPFTDIKEKEEIGVVSPLTPIVIVPSGEQLPLVATALGGNVLSNQMYVVPAIFLKYRGDKIRNDYIEKGVITTLDIATIALSGGTALATKVHWVRRAWALAEVAGAVGNIAVNTQTVGNPEFRKLIDNYNLAMGLIGIKQIGQAGYKFVKNLPKETKLLLQRNGELHQMLLKRYRAWKAQRARLGSDLSVPEQQILAQQEKVWEALDVTEDVIETSDVVYKQSTQVGKKAKNIAEHELLRGIDPQQILEAQEVLTKAGHTRLAMQADALRIVIELRAHRNFKAFGLTDDLLGKISSTVNTEGYAQIVTNLRTFIDKFDHNKVEGLNKLVSFLGDQKQSFREGAEWTLRYLANHADEFTPASKISFEVTGHLDKGTRVADIVVEYPNLAPIYYEFKSVTVLPPNRFVEQFSKDLSRPNFSIDNLRWVFDGKKITRQDLDKLRRDIEKALSGQFPTMPKEEKERFVKRILNEVFIVN